ncbi:MAG: metallophosphoesterase family protein [Trueperaceae bacterium]|nr:metallophosphoesterase family protein [Trueperaceae bacterium]
MRYLVFGDVHGNAPALDAVLHDAGLRGYDAALFLGDLLGYYPYPVEVVERLRALAPSVRLLGNHDALLLSLADGGDALHAKEGTLVVDVVRRHLAALGERDVAFVRGAALRADDVVWSASHGAFRRPFEYLSGLPEAKANLEALPTPLGLVGHTHVARGFAMIEVDQRTLWRTVEFHGGRSSYQVPPRARAFLNPGSVGQPRDGDPHAAYALFEPLKRRFAVHRVAYDVAAVQRRVRQEGYPAVLAERLEHGR